MWLQPTGTKGWCPHLPPLLIKRYLHKVRLLITTVKFAACTLETAVSECSTPYTTGWRKDR